MPIGMSAGFEMGELGGKTICSSKEAHWFCYLGVICGSLTSSRFGALHNVLPFMIPYNRARRLHMILIEATTLCIVLTILVLEV